MSITKESLMRFLKQKYGKDELYYNRFKKDELISMVEIGHNLIKGDVPYSSTKWTCGAGQYVNPINGECVDKTEYESIINRMPFEVKSLILGPAWAQIELRKKKQKKGITKPSLTLKTKPKLAPGMDQEKKFWQSLLRFSGYQLSPQDKQTLIGYGFKIKPVDKISISNVVWPTNSKKSDVIIMMNGMDDIGVSYKKDTYRTVQSWSKISVWEDIFGKDLDKILGEILKKTNEKADYYKGNDDKLFLGSTINIGVIPDTNSKLGTDSIKLDSIIKINNTMMQRILFGSGDDDSSCNLMYIGTTLGYKTFTEFLNDPQLLSTCQSISSLKPKLKIDVRYSFMNTSSSNNGQKLLVHWVSNGIPPKGTPLTSPTDILNYGTFMTYKNTKPYYGTCASNLNTWDIMFKSENMGYTFPKTITTKKPINPRLC